VGTRGIEYEARDGAAWVTLDRAAQGNRFTHEMAAAFAEACEAAEDGDVGVVVVRARGRAFCRGLAAGVDAWDLRKRRNPVEALAAVTKPVLAVLSGPAVGAGAELALAADLRLATPRAVFRFSDVGTGRVPCFGATQRLPRIVGRTRALEILLLGASVRAPEAARLGLVSRVVASARLDHAVAELTARLRAQGPLAVALAKEAVRRAGDLPLADGLRLEEDLYVLLQTTADRREGVRSFLEKRRPRFHGR
jgi:2-(1,2-epoxy-1,2-dihydrophenyl)acetyl-CoA isomerase